LRAPQDFWPTRFFAADYAATAHFKRVGAIRQIIQSVLKVALISTSLTKKLEHHDAYRHEVIHTAGERLQQEV
jgi:hypothetical protein